MRILAVTGTRADWGLLAPVLDLLRRDPRFDLSIMATGQHLMAGNSSLAEIAADGHKVDHALDMGLGAQDSAGALASAMGLAVAGTGEILTQARPDLLLVLGDRYEILAVALAAVVARVPIVHLCGGDVTEGAMDDAIRHALTKLSVLHFPTNPTSAARIVQLGEDPECVLAVGSTGIDRIRAVPTLSRQAFFESVGLVPQSANFVVTLHPATLAADPIAEARAALTALDGFPAVGLIFTGSNADPGAREIDDMVRSFAQARGDAVFHTSLGSQRYFSALTHCNVLLGNSSSGIMEAPSFAIPTVNIGDRQRGRARAHSVLDCAANPKDIMAAIAKALTLDCSSVVSPYGDGFAAQKIVTRLANISAPQDLLRKSFRDIAHAF